MTKGMQERGSDFTPAPGRAQFKRFGPFGLAYQVLRQDSRTARIKVIETGEELDYPVSKLQQDPEA